MADDSWLEWLFKNSVGFLIVYAKSEKRKTLYFTHCKPVNERAANNVCSAPLCLHRIFLWCFSFIKKELRRRQREKTNEIKINSSERGIGDFFAFDSVWTLSLKRKRQIYYFSQICAKRENPQKHQKYLLLTNILIPQVNSKLKIIAIFLTEPATRAASRGKCCKFYFS